MSDFPFTDCGLILNFGSFDFSGLFLGDYSLCLLSLGPLAVLVSVSLNVLKLRNSGPGWKFIFSTLLIMYL